MPEGCPCCMVVVGICGLRRRPAGRQHHVPRDAAARSVNFDSGGSCTFEGDETAFEPEGTEHLPQAAG